MKNATALLRRCGARAWRFGLAGMLVAGFLAGCTSSPGTSSRDEFPLSESNRELARRSLAAVEIRGQPLITVAETVESVFTQNGFMLLGRTAELLTFERPATRAQSAAYGSWSGGDVRVRLKVEVYPQGTRVYLLCCRAYIAREAGSASEDEQPLARRKVREYEDFLFEVARRLN